MKKVLALFVLLAGSIAQAGTLINPSTPQDLAATSAPTFSGITLTGASSSTASDTATTSGTSILNNNIVTIAPTSGSTATYMGRADQIQFTGTANITGGGHPIGGYHYAVMNAAGKTVALMIANEGKLYVQAGTLSSGASVHCGLQNVEPGATLSVWTGCNAQISDNNGSLPVANGHDLTVAAATVAIGTLRGYHAPDVTIAKATNYAGFWGDVASGANHFNLYMPGTAQNYLNGRTTIGTSTDDGVNQLQVTGPAKITGTIAATGQGTIPFYTTSGTAINAPHAVQGTCTLSSNQCTVNFTSSAVFTSNSSYDCPANSTTSAAPVRFAPQSGSQVIFTSTAASDTVAFTCFGT